MTNKEKEDCHLIIHGASLSAAAVGGGLAQLPLADSAVLVPIQIAMVIALGNVFGKHVTDSAAKGAVLGAAAGFIGRATSQVLFGWIPVLGNMINACTAAGLTEAIGWGMADKFDRDETI